MKIIAVAGGTATGKSTFSRLLSERLPNSAILPLDSYYHERPDHIPMEQYNFDVPQAFDLTWVLPVNGSEGGRTEGTPNKRMSSM